MAVKAAHERSLPPTLYEAINWIVLVCQPVCLCLSLAIWSPYQWNFRAYNKQRTLSWCMDKQWFLYSFTAAQRIPCRGLYIPAIALAKQSSLSMCAQRRQRNSSDRDRVAQYPSLDEGRNRIRLFVPCLLLNKAIKVEISAAHIWMSGCLRRQSISSVRVFVIDTEIETKCK